MGRRFRRISGNAFGQGLGRVSAYIANWVLMVQWLCSTNPENWRWYAQWKCCKTGQTVQTWSTWPGNRVPQSLCSSRGVPRVGIIFSNRIGLTKQGKALVQWENLQTMTKTYLCPWEGGSCMKSICQTKLEWSIGQFKIPTGSMDRFPRIIFWTSGTR